MEEGNIAVIHFFEKCFLACYSILAGTSAMLYYFARWNMTELSMALYHSIEIVAIASVIYFVFTRLTLGIPGWTNAQMD